MPIATGLALALGAAAAAGGSVASSKIQSNATKTAATQAQDSADKSLDFQREVFNTQQENQRPWLEQGRNALEMLAKGFQPGGAFTQQYGKEFNPGTFDGGPAFQAPSGTNMQADPGYAFRLAEGQKALERSAAARGTATGGAALKAAQRFGQDYASNEYGNVYGRALQSYQTNFGNRLNSFITNTNTGRDAFNTNYNVWSGDNANRFNRLAALAGLGQSSANQLNAAGSNAAGNVSSIYGNLGNNLSNLTTQGGNATAAGIVGATNAFSSYGDNLLKSDQNYQKAQILDGLIAAQRQSGYR